MANKKTFLLIQALETATPLQKKALQHLLSTTSPDKIPATLELLKACGVDKWAMELKKNYTELAFKHLEDIAVVNARKAPLRELAAYLLQREV